MELDTGSIVAIILVPIIFLVCIWFVLKQVRERGWLYRYN